MLIKSTSLTIKYKKINNLKKMFFLHNEVLDTAFNEATVLPIPENAPDEIPRIILTTKNEHAQLSITPVAAAVQIEYDNGYELDWEKCENYLKDLMRIVLNFFDFMTQNSYEYMGIITTLFLDDYMGNVTHTLSKNLLKADNKELYDINLKYTFTKADEFINISLQNARLFKKGIDENCAGALGSDNEVCQYVGASIDINNRYGFNTIKNYETTSEKISSLLETMTNVVQEKLETLVVEGVYEYGTE